MDNVVQNINVEDIVPSKFQLNNENEHKIDKLAQLIKNFGIIDPILVRAKNGKYEIILGNENYQAAKIAGLKSIPAVIKEIDDETFSKYSLLDNPTLKQESLSQSQKIHQDNFLEVKKELHKEIPNEKNLGIKNNLDIVNLSELNKKEYERNDIEMNNEQLNTNMMNSNFNQSQQNQMNQSQQPTFGGRFFPSLEDAPTNMNMMTGNIPQQPMQNNQSSSMGTNNLIDLTDLSLDKEPTITPTTPEFTSTPISQPLVSEPIGNQAPQNFQMPQSDFGIPTQNFSQVYQPTDNIINLENLQNNNQIAPASPIVSNDFQNLNQESVANQFDMSKNIAPQTPFTSPSSLNQPNNLQSTDIEFHSEQSIPNNFSKFDNQLQENTSSIPSINNDLTATSPIPSTESINQETKMKDVTPVINTIKSLANNLESFGYKIIINEEDLPTTKKIIIEVEK